MAIVTTPHFPDAGVIGRGQGRGWVSGYFGRSAIFVLIVAVAFHGRFLGFWQRLNLSELRASPTRASTSKMDQGANVIGDMNVDMSVDSSMDAEGKVIVVGGGLAGLAATLAALEQGARVLLIEKAANIGGNSAKATSGINAVDSRAQRQAKAALGKPGAGGGLANHAVPRLDSVELFSQDILNSGHGLNNPELVQVLAARSGMSLDKLEEWTGLDLSDLQILGGHQAKRTHRIPAKEGRLAPVGWSVMSALKKKAEALAEEGRIEIWTKARVVDFAMTPADDTEAGSCRRVTSVLVERTQKDADVEPASVSRVMIENFSAVVFAAGGYSADASPSSFLARVRPDLAGLPTTNDAFATGDLVKLAIEKQIQTVDLDKIQLHPTGFVDVKNLESPKKFLCPEVMRGLGAILINAQGLRFVDELTSRDVVSAAIRSQSNTAQQWGLTTEAGHATGGTATSSLLENQMMSLLVMSEETAHRFGMAAFKFYESKGFIRRIESAAALKDFAPSLSYDSLKQTLVSYSHLAQSAPNADKDSLNKDSSFGKTVFPEDFESVTKNNAPFYVSFVTPSLHFSMGGFAIDSSSRAVDATADDGRPVVNLFVAGENAGGVHGGNRLGGNGCLESLVFGILSGEGASTLASTHLVSTGTKPGQTSNSGLKFEAGFSTESVEFPVLFTNAERDLISLRLPRLDDHVPSGLKLKLSALRHRSSRAKGEPEERRLEMAGEPAILASVDGLLPKHTLTHTPSHTPTHTPSDTEPQTQPEEKGSSELKRGVPGQALFRMEMAAAPNDVDELSTADEASGQGHRRRVLVDRCALKSSMLSNVYAGDVIVASVSIEEASN